MFSFLWDLKFEATLSTKPQKLSFASFHMYLKDKKLIHNGETPTIYKFSAKTFDTDFNYVIDQ